MQRAGFSKNGPGFSRFLEDALLGHSGEGVRWGRVSPFSTQRWDVWPKLTSPKMGGLLLADRAHPPRWAPGHWALGSRSSGFLSLPLARDEKQLYSSRLQIQNFWAPSFSFLPACKQANSLQSASLFCGVLGDGTHELAGGCRNRVGQNFTVLGAGRCPQIASL